jgi:hypothetical protein
VLIIVLVMVGLGIATTVKRVLSELPPVTQEQLAQLIKEMAEIQLPETPAKVEEQMKLTAEQIKKLVEDLKTLDLTQAHRDVKFIDLEALRLKIERAKYDRDKEKKELDELFAEVDRLKKQLDDTPEFKPLPSKFVRIPNPRPVPEGAIRENFLIAKGRVIYLNDRAFKDLIVSELEKNKRSLLAPDSTSSKPVYSVAKVLGHFVRNRVGDRTLHATLVPVKEKDFLNVNLVPEPMAGEADQQIRDPASVFQRALRKFKSDKNSVVWFYVFNDSVDTYILARELADQLGVPVGWQLYAKDYFEFRLPDIKVDTKLPPPAPNGTLPPVKKDEIVPPKEQLD